MNGIGMSTRPGPMRDASSWWLLSLLLPGLLSAQSVTFSERFGLLDESGIDNPPFRSGAAVGVVDID